MISRGGRNKVTRILDYLAKQERKTCWSGTTDSADDLRLAWWTLWFAALQESPDPYDAALRKMLGPRYKSYKATRNTLPAVYTGSGDGPHEVDGRTAHQWVQSVLAYLDWRSGMSWRPMADRFHPDRTLYTESSLRLRQAYYNTPNRPPSKSKAADQPARSEPRAKSA
jgi:hypothetical protein